jgi:hypothetical protein
MSAMGIALIEKGFQLAIIDVLKMRVNKEDVDRGRFLSSASAPGAQRRSYPQLNMRLWLRHPCGYSSQ